MKIPEKAPDWGKLSNECINADLATKTIDIVRKANSEYLYWDDFKYQPMLDGVTHEAAWAMLKTLRLFQTRRISLADSSGRYFGYWLPDCVLKEIHYIDQQAGGAILAEHPLVHSEEKQRYMIRSIVEEAISSSEIEGAVTTRVVAKEMLRTGRKPADRSEHMIYNNYRSMQMIKRHLSEPLTIDLIKRIHASMTESTLEIPSWAGRFRTPEDEEIHVFDSDGQILHAPPKAADVLVSMQNLCNFANVDTEDEFVNPIIKGILIHFWLAYVHPFMDGNGRTARALFYWYMLKHNYWLFEYLSVSTAILRARSQYYKSFLYSEIDDNDVTYFIVYNLKAIHRALEILNAYIERKQKEKRHTYRFAEIYPALNLRQRALLASALERPKETYTIETHSNVHGVTYQTARTDLLGLKDMGLLDLRKEGKKFIFTPVADIAIKLDRGTEER
ncbi:MAG: Fic family protein [Nitrospirae bacterium]|nr:Fic family protein [Nitrospirota bacterium]